MNNFLNVVFFTKLILTPFKTVVHFSFVLSQTYLTLIKFFKKYDNIYRFCPIKTYFMVIVFF
jgi:hypothetical protein